MKIQGWKYLLGSAVFISQFALAKPFKSQFISLQLPPNWDCKQEELDWVCQPDNLAERAEAILVIVTKATNDIDDTFEKYEQVLSQSRPMRDLLGNSYKSKVNYVRSRDIKGQKWVDSLHLGSEVPGFYTRYIASIKEKVAGLVTYSVAESVYPKYAPVLDQMIDSLEIKFDPQAFAEAMKSSPGSLLSRGKVANNRLAPGIEDENAKGKKDGGMDMTQIFGILVVVGAAGYLYWKKKKQGGTGA